jgi:hypothetical protein
MEDSNPRRIMRRHLVLTKRIRALDHRRDSAEFAEGRLLDYAARIKELIRLRDESPEEISTLNGMIAVSLKILQLKRQEFNLPVVHGDDDPNNLLDEGGSGVPSPVQIGPFSLTGCGGRLFSESDECNDW